MAAAIPFSKGASMAHVTRRSWNLVPAVLALAASLACGGGGGGGGGTGNGWTVLVYTVADNNLEPYALYNLEQMAAVGSSAGLNIVAEVDRAPTGQYTPAGTGLVNLPAWTTARRLLVKQGSFQQLSDLGEIDTADPANLADFIEWGVKAYPADHYMLVLWDHGGGWQGFGVDETSNDMMKLLSIRNGVRDGLAAAGLAKLDVLGFDACMMASLEVAEALAPYSRYLLASEETEPGHGWDYRSLSGAASLDPLALSKRIVDGYQAIANSAQWNDGAGITLSVVDLTKLGPIEAGLAKLAADFGTTAALAPYTADLGQGLRSSVAFGANPDPSSAYNLVDAGDLFLNAAALGADAAALRTAVQGAVAYKVNGSAYAQATGLSIYFPTSPGYYSSTLYDALPGMDDWRTFLAAFYGAADAVPAPTFASGTYNATRALFTLDGVLTAGTLATLSSASLVYGLPGDSGDAWVFGEQPAATYNDGSGDHVTGDWDYSFLHLAQASTAHEEYGYASIAVPDSTTAILSIPMSYYPTGGGTAQSAVRALVFNLSAGTILSDVYYLESNGALGQLVPAAGSTLHAQVIHLPDGNAWAGEWVDYTDAGAFDAADEIQLDFSTTLGIGASLFAGLRIENAAGDVGWIATDALAARP
jgi:hypothetical protein